MISDPIADFLTRIRNAQMIGKSTVTVPFSKLKHVIANVMKRFSFLKNVEVVEEKFSMLRLTLNLDKDIALKRVSKPGQRIYKKGKEIHNVKNGYGISIVSTSQGIMAGHEARKKNIGGELLCTIS